MTKKITFFLLALLWAGYAFGGVFVRVDGLNYKIDSATKIASMASPVGESFLAHSQIDFNGETYLVKSIEPEAFKERFCSSVTIPKSVETIGNNAFYAYSGDIILESSTPPVIKGDAFLQCYTKSIYVPCDAVETYKNAAGWKTMGKAIVGKPHTITLKSNNPEWGYATVLYPYSCESQEVTIATTLMSEQYTFAK